MTEFPQKTLADWDKLAAKDLGADGDLSKLTWKTPEGLDVKALYTAADLEGLELDTLPGFPPYTRGPRATMYAVKPWTIRQYAGFSTAEESNAFYKANLKAGQMGLSVAFDLATHRGYDSDHPRVVGDVGKAGVAIDSVEDMKLLFADIPLDKMSVSDDHERRGAADPRRLHRRGGGAGGFPGQAERHHPETTSSRSSWSATPTSTRPNPRCGSSPDIIEYTSQHMPKFNSISISGYHMQEAGATAVQELAFTIADGLEYVRAAMSKGLAVDKFAPRLSFFFSIGMNFFMEIAKLRAARLLWSSLMQEKFAPKDVRSLALRTHCQTSGVSLTEQDPYNNVHPHHHRGDGGGAGRPPSRCTPTPFDEALGLPTKTSAPHRPQHPADHRRGGRRHQGGRSARRLLLHRAPDPQPRQRRA